jgi:hypothetical protein
MALTKPKRLVKALFDKTQTGSVDWHESAAADTFQVSFKDHSVQIAMRKGRDELMDYVISVLNEEGTVVDRFSDEELDTEDDGTIKGRGWYALMLELYNLALRHARGADKALNAILDELGERPF